MTTTTVLLIRHAAHDRLDRVLCGRMAGVRLGEEGLRQARSVAEAMDGSGVAAVYASPLERAQETAAPLAARLGVTTVTDSDLDELDVGAWSGRTFAELHADDDWARWNRLRVQSRPPGGESLLETQVRVVRFFHRVRARHADETIAAVSHGDVIKTAICWAVGLSLEFYGRLEIAPASVSRVLIGDWGVKMWSCNEVRP